MKNNLGSFATDKRSLRRGKSKAGRVFVALSPISRHFVLQLLQHFNPNGKAAPQAG
jgi:hypothetical protein